MHRPSQNDGTSMWRMGQDLTTPPHTFVADWDLIEFLLKRDCDITSLCASKVMPPALC